MAHARAGRYLAEHILGAKYVEVLGDDHVPYMGDPRPMLDEIGEFITGDTSDPRAGPCPRHRALHRHRRLDRAGECEVLGEKVGGIAVHIGARVSSLAGPSEVLVSRTVKDLVAGSGIAFEDRGLHPLKGIPDEWQLFAVAPESK